MIAVDGSELDEPLASTAHRLFGDGAQYWAVNVRLRTDESAVPMPTTFPAMYGGSFIGFGTAYPYLAPNPYEVQVTDVGPAGDLGPHRASSASAGSETPDHERTDEVAHLAEVGDPPEAILRAARHNEVDVIVVGDHDRSWWSKLIDPPVSDELIDRAEIPVLVVTAEAAGMVEEEPSS
jgi:nucleotide-binding universal stress UspA family protein